MTIAADVKCLFDTNMTATQLAPFVTTASLVVSAYCSNTASINVEVKKYLTAHFASLYDPRAAVEKVGDAQTTYQGTTGESLKSTFYGQTALLLDNSKGLFNLDKKKQSAYFKVDI